MEQREVQDSDNIVWTCVQAYAGSNSKLAEKAAKLDDSGDGRVTVVCTPSGGAQTVRLQLSESWLKDLSDEDLLEAIVTERK